MLRFAKDHASGGNPEMINARFDKEGRPLPDTGRGCGCSLCAQANAARYERRREPRRELWSQMRRSLATQVWLVLPG